MPKHTRFNASFLFRGIADGLLPLSGILFVWMIVACLPQQLLAQRHEASEKRFGEVAKLAEEHLKILSVKDGRLNLDLPKSQEARDLIRKINGGYSSGGGGGSAGRWNYHMYDANISFRFAEGINRMDHLDKRLRKYLAIEEVHYPFRGSIATERESHLELFSHLPAEHKLAWIRQGENNTIATMIDEDKVQSFSGRSLAELVVMHDMATLTAEFKANALPVDQLGTSNRIVDVVVDLLMFDENRVSELKEQWADLAADDFQTRSDATKRLKVEFGQQRTELAFVLLHPKKFSLPIRAAFSETVKAIKADDDRDEKLSQAERKAQKLLENDKSAIRTVVEGKLHQQPAVLIRLLGQIETAKWKVDKAVLMTKTIEQLEAVTDQKLGKDIKQWQAWQLEQISADSKKSVSKKGNEKSKTDSTKAKEDAAQSVATFARTELAQLLVLTIGENGRLQLDRNQWKQSFSNKPAKQILADIQKQMKESGVPQSWVKIGNGYDWDYVDYPQMLLEKYEFALNEKNLSSNPLSRYRSTSRSSYRNQKEKSLNREIEFGPVRGRLMMHPQQRGAGEPKQEYFLFDLNDASSDGEFIVRVLEKESECFSLMAKSADEAKVLMIGQNESGRCWIHLGAGADLKSAAADSAKELFEQNREWITSDVAAFVSECGINFSEPLGGPFNIANAVPAKKK